MYKQYFFSASIAYTVSIHVRTSHYTELPSANIYVLTCMKESESLLMVERRDSSAAPLLRHNDAADGVESTTPSLPRELRGKKQRKK